MIRSIIVLAACVAALSGIAQAQDVSTNAQACFTFCGNTLDTDAQNALIKCNPVTVIDVANCFCDNKAIISKLQSCAALACPVFKNRVAEQCDDLHDGKSSGVGATTGRGIALLVVPSAVIMGTLFL